MARTYHCAAICYDPPGRGLTHGRATETSYHDALATVMRWVERDVLHTINRDGGLPRIVLIGHSLGTGVVVKYAVENKWVAPIVLISPYKSVPRIVCDSAVMDSLVSKTQFNSIARVDQLKCGVRIIHGDKDEVINIQHARDLFEQAPNKTFAPVWVESAGHGDILERMPGHALGDVLGVGVGLESSPSSRP